MRPDIIEIVSPERQLAAGVIQAVEQFFVQKLVPQAPVEALGEGILLEFSRIGIMPIDAIITSSFLDRTVVELRR